MRSARMRPVGEVRQRATSALAQRGIDVPVATQAVIVAAAAGVVAALLDEILGLPTTWLLFTFGSVVAALSGMAYVLWKNVVSTPAALMSIVTGLVAYAAWYIVREIVGDVYGNIFKAIVTGGVAGLVGAGGSC